MKPVGSQAWNTELDKYSISKKFLKGKIIMKIYCQRRLIQWRRNRNYTSESKISLALSLGEVCEKNAAQQSTETYSMEKPRVRCYSV